MRFAPRPYQQAAIDRMLGMDYQLVALSMGFGKSAVTLAVLDELLTNRFEVAKVLIVAPLRVAQLVWHAEAAKWDDFRHLRVSRVLGTAKQRTEALLQDAEIYCINVENLPWLTKLVEDSGQPWPFDCVVIDENKGLKDRGSATFKALKRVRREVKRMYLLTGTPTPNGLLQLWPQVSILDQGQRLGSGITKYRDRWFLPDRRNGMTVYTWKPRPGAEREIQEAVKDMMFTVDGGVDLPERIDNTVLVVVGDTARARMSEIERAMVTGNVSAANAAVLAGKLAQMANGAVYDDLGGVEVIHDAKLDALQEIVEQGQPVLVLAAYRHDIARVKARFPQAREFDGEDSLRSWQAGKVEVLVMHPASGGHGVDGLQLGGSTVVWFGLPFSLDLYQQATARIHRSGQTRTVVVHHLVAAGTIDERIAAVLVSKGDVQQALLTAVREVLGGAA